jgi:hypothetical protein
MFTRTVDSERTFPTTAHSTTGAPVSPSSLLNSRIAYSTSVWFNFSRRSITFSLVIPSPPSEAVRPPFPYCPSFILIFVFLTNISANLYVHEIWAARKHSESIQPFWLSGYVYCIFLQILGLESHKNTIRKKIQGNMPGGASVSTLNARRTRSYTNSVWKEEALLHHWGLHGMNGDDTRTDRIWRSRSNGPSEFGYGPT